MESSSSGGFETPPLRVLRRAPLPRAYTNYLGHGLFNLISTLQGLGAFSLITLGVILTKFGAARQVTQPAIRRELARSGIKLVPMFLFVSMALGFVVIGETASLLTKLGKIELIGQTMVYVVVRELGPFITAMLVLARSGAANVIELGTSRALGEVEALEALGIDPVHYLVMPRVIGMALGVFGLTIYFIVSSMLSGYLFTFIQDLHMSPGDYFEALRQALNEMDFLILTLKSGMFGMAIALITCYHGLSQPLHLADISQATVRAVAQSLIACVILDVFFFMVIYLTT